MMRRLIPFVALSLLLMLAGAASAQTGGQFCVRAFEDRNGNGRIDSGEPFLTRDVGASLLDADGVVIATALMDDSPTAAQGVICFQFLEPGQYSMQITSAAFAPTTPDTVTASIGTGTLPTVVEYGARTVAEPTPIPTSQTGLNIDLPENDLVRVGLSLGAALAVMMGMAVLGAIVYVLAVRPRRAAAPAYPERRPPTTGSGSMPPVRTDIEDASFDDDIPFGGSTGQP